MNTRMRATGLLALASILLAGMPASADGGEDGPLKDIQVEVVDYGFVRADGQSSSFPVYVPGVSTGTSVPDVEAMVLVFYDQGSKVCWADSGCTVRSSSQPCRVELYGFVGSHVETARSGGWYVELLGNYANSLSSC